MKAVVLALFLALAGSSAHAQSQLPGAGELAQFKFTRGSSKLAVYGDDPRGRRLGELAAWAVNTPDGLIVLDGHADALAGGKRSLTLALDRAKVVRIKLVEAGVDPNQIVIAAYSQTKHPTARGKVVAWGMKGDVTAVASRSRAKGRAVILTSLDLDRPGRPAAVARQ